MEGRRRGLPATPRGPEGALLEGVCIKEEAEWSEAEGAELVECVEQLPCIKQEPPQAPEHGLPLDTGHRGHVHIKEEVAECEEQMPLAPPGGVSARSVAPPGAGAGVGGVGARSVAPAAARLAPVGGGGGGGGIGARFAGRVVAGELVLEPLCGRGARGGAAGPGTHGREEREEAESEEREGAGGGGGARLYAGLVVWAGAEGPEGPDPRAARGAMRRVAANARARERRRRREAGPYVCDVCGKTYKRRRVIIRHIQHKHDPRAKRKPYACPMCSKAYARADSLSKHRRTHAELERYSCAACPARFRRPDLLQRHRRSCDAGDQASGR